MKPDPKVMEVSSNNPIDNMPFNFKYNPPPVTLLKEYASNENYGEVEYFKREKATSNICSNQSLIALSATLYLSLLGEKGFRETGIISATLAHKLSENLEKKGIKTLNKTFFNFITNTS